MPLHCGVVPNATYCDIKWSVDELSLWLQDKHSPNSEALFITKDAFSVANSFDSLFWALGTIP